MNEKNIVGIIAEYNPLHNGHKYQIEKIKETLNPDSIVVAMSQDVVQRGEFASFDKHFRTKKALEAGADLVLGLPYLVSGQSAEFFARGALRELNSLGITTLVFGAEDDNISEFEKIADILNNEPIEFKNSLKENLKNGLSFPRARAEALKKFNIDSSLLEKPNNILAIEYIKAIRKYYPNIKPYIVKRIGNDYNDEFLTGKFSSATSIRKALKNKIEDLELFVPYSSSELKKNYNILNEENVFVSLMSLFFNNDKSYFRYFVDSNDERINKIYKNLGNFKTLEDLKGFLKSKNTTLTTINRFLLNLLFNLKKQDLEYFYSKEYTPYLRVLGLKKESSYLLKNLNIPIISTVSKDVKKLNKEQFNFFNFDLRVSNFRNLFMGSKEYNKDYYSQPIIF